MIARVGPCIGLTLFRWFRFKVELWFAPASYCVPEHTHNDSSSEFYILYSKNRYIYRRIGTRIESYITRMPGIWERCLSVRAGTPHGFTRGKTCMIWLVFETWKKGAKVTSVAEDFHLT